MQSRQKRQRNRERKRLEREEKRRNRQASSGAGPSVRTSAERGAQMCAPGSAPVEPPRTLAEYWAQTSARRARGAEYWNRFVSELDIEEAQMCAQANLGERMPRHAAVTMAAAFRKARHEARRWLTAGECLVRIAQHCLDVWRPLVNERSPPMT
jgi:hypothetical protein